MNWLKTQPDIWFYKTDDRTHPGIPDIIGCKSGRFFAIEIKRPEKSKTFKLQIFNVNQINKCGGYAFICDDVDEMKRFINII